MKNDIKKSPGEIRNLLLLRKSNLFPNKNHTFLNNHKKEVKTLINHKTDKAEADELIIKSDRVSFICDRTHFNNAQQKTKRNTVI